MKGRMMDIILFIFAIVYVIKRPKIALLKAADYPDVPSDKFEEWKRLDLLSRDIIIWVGFGWIAIEVIGAIILRGYVFGLAILALPVLLISMIIAAIFGTKANKIKKFHNIVIR